LLVAKLMRQEYLLLIRRFEHSLRFAWYRSNKCCHCPLTQRLSKTWSFVTHCYAKPIRPGFYSFEKSHRARIKRVWKV